jgi:DUF1009 family protein
VSSKVPSRRADSPSPLGILACAGPLPVIVADAATRAGRAVHVVAIEGFAGDEVRRFPHAWASLGQVGRILASFDRAGVRQIVIAGAMQRPDLVRLRVDWGFVRNIPTVLALTQGGDDSVLRRVVRFFESHGLEVIGAAEVAPELLAPAGNLGGVSPVDDQRAALARAARLVAALAPFDIGQAVVATAAEVVAVEGVRGTDALLRDLGPGGLGEGQARGGVLAKLAKPGQEMRIDLPTVGPVTIERAAAAGLAGIGLGAGGTIVLERERAVVAADAAGIFVTGLETAPVIAEAEGEDGPPSLPEGTALRVLARRAPTPADRRDIAIGRRLVAVLRRHEAGRAALVAREHVLAVSAKLPLAPLVAAQGRPASWGRRWLSTRIGALVVDGDEALSAGGADAILDADLFRAAMSAGLAGIVYLGRLPEGERRSELVAWANEASVFLMAIEALA